MAFRFRPHHRIRSPRDFARAFRRGSRARGSILMVVAHENGLDHARLGLSIGKRVWKSAARRNRVRRIFRESFRLEAERLPAGHDLVLVAAQPKLEPELEETRAELVALARKAARRLAERREKEAASAAALEEGGAA